MQIAQDMPDPKISSMPKLEGVIRGIRTYQLKHANKQRFGCPLLRKFC